MQLPGPVRAAVGLIATAADEARNLPDRAFELPMLAVSTALQASLRAQQRYAQLTARGDEALARGRTGDDPPEWATFDDPLPAEADEPAPDALAPDAPVDDAQVDDDEPAPRPRPAAADEPARRATAAAKTAAAKKAAVKRAATARRSTPKTPTDGGETAPTPPGKSVGSPRVGTPSRFDTVDMSTAEQSAGDTDDADNTDVPDPPRSPAGPDA